MAHIESQQVGEKVVTYVRGRVFFARRKHTLASRTSPESRERRRICVLSVRAASELENWNINQPCYGDKCRHAHQTRMEIQKLVDEGQMRWVGRGKNVSTWVEAKELMPRRSDGVTVVQLVTIGSGVSRLQQRESRI